MKRHILTSVGIAAMALLAVGAAAVPAMAVDREPNAIAAIRRAAPAVLANLAPAAELRDARRNAPVDGNANGAQVDLPASPAEPLVLSDDHHADLAVSLPIASAVVDLSSTDLPVYSAGQAAQLVPVVKDDGSVQVTTVLCNWNW